MIMKKDVILRQADKTAYPIIRITKPLCGQVYETVLLLSHFFMPFRSGRGSLYVFI